MSDQEQLNEFIKQVFSYKDEKALGAFFEAILTPKELEEIPMRLQIIKMLKQGLPQREIADKLGVGVATVTRGSKEIHKGNFKDID